MDYAKHYWTLIDRARIDRPVKCGTERHHILPRCMGGGNESDNIVRLKSEEHYVAHLLLAKMHPDSRKLAYACFSMKKRAGSGYVGSENKRYAKGMEDVHASRRDWRARYTHRLRKKKRYDATDVERMIRILAPRRVSA